MKEISATSAGLKVNILLISKINLFFIPEKIFNNKF